MSPYANLAEATEARRGSNPANIGLAALLVAGALIGLNFSKSLPWSHPHTIRLTFTHATQIVRNSAVRIGGVEVGKVTKVESGPGTTALVTAKVEDEALPIKRDATAKIRPRLFLEGNFFIDLNPGSPSAPALGDGGTIPVTQTSVPVQLDQFASLARKDIRRTFKGSFKELVDSTQGTAPQGFGRLVGDLAPLSRDFAYVSVATLGALPHDLSEAIGGTSRTIAAIGRRPEDLRLLLDSFAKSSADLASQQTALAGTLSALDRVSATGVERLGTITASFPATRELIRDLRPALRASPPVLDHALPVVTQLRLALRDPELPGLIRDLRPAVTGLAGFAPQGQVLFEKLAPTVSCLRRNVVPALKTPVEDPPLSTGQPVYRDLLSTLVGLASASRNFDGNGFATRYYSTFGTELLSNDTTATLNSLISPTDRPLLGSRPKFLGKSPTFHPEAPCTEQPPTSFAAETGPADLTPRKRIAKAPLFRSGSLTVALRRLRRAVVADSAHLRRLVRGREQSGGGK